MVVGRRLGSQRIDAYRSLPCSWKQAGAIPSILPGLIRTCQLWATLRGGIIYIAGVNGSGAASSGSCHKRHAHDIQLATTKDSRFAVGTILFSCAFSRRMDVGQSCVVDLSLGTTLMIRKIGVRTARERALGENCAIKPAITAGALACGHCATYWRTRVETCGPIWLTTDSVVQVVERVDNSNANNLN